jgi:peptidyl-prolyl cis-trans isomerase B (cyclophilin B)
MTKVSAEADANPTDPALFAMLVQLSGWIEDDKAQEAAYAKLVGLQPNNDVAGGQWVASLAKRGRYDEAINVANARFPDYAKAPRVALAVADALVALNRFDDALAALNAITATVPADLGVRNGQLRNRVTTLGELWKAELAKRSEEDAKGENARVLFTTSKGPIVLELFEKEAPGTCNAFIELVESGAYNQTHMHRRIPGLAVLGGDPNTKPGAKGQPGYGTIGWRIADEGNKPDRREAFGGTIGLCKASDAKQQGYFAPNSAASQFFLLLQPAEFVHDDTANLTIFGRVVEGWDVVASLEPKDELISATTVRKGAHEYKAERAPELLSPTSLEMTIPTRSMPAPRPAARPPQLTPTGQPRVIPTPPTGR